MKVGIMQPYFFPYWGYFKLIAFVDKFICLDDVNFIKKGWINRNQILIKNEAQYITVPLKKISQNRLISEHIISYDHDWQDKLLNTIEASYKKAPFFELVFPLVKSLIGENGKTISELNYDSLKRICEFVGITTEIIPSSTIYDKKELRGEDRIIDICVQENATDYFNLPGGKSLYQNSSFEERSMKLNFIEVDSFSYEQFKEEFIPNLSIIDVLMFNSTEDFRAKLLS